jgi:hypothetical protein
MKPTPSSARPPRRKPCREPHPDGETALWQREFNHLPKLVTQGLGKAASALCIDLQHLREWLLTAPLIISLAAASFVTANP